MIAGEHRLDFHGINGLLLAAVSASLIGYHFSGREVFLDLALLLAWVGFVAGFTSVVDDVASWAAEREKRGVGPAGSGMGGLSEAEIRQIIEDLEEAAKTLREERRRRIEKLIEEYRRKAGEYIACCSADGGGMHG